ncbi:hypothetical protein EAO73_35750 [Streptomyces sp. col6]|uniref:hypothetical protein n=1 Tax=Streptomyces sp. col6 TaxID=2478958 RepID=UPI0011CE89E2|nr:hypothetical protein [Streptomyces sp. col6]TXR91742.1 hypothetical protein EAO73_35750 [Streptomyces sp. col6]
MTTTLALIPALTGTCPNCGGTFETCTCTGVVPAPLPRAGWLEDWEEQDNQRGPERDETDQFHRLIGDLVLDGDTRARAAGRRARRTLDEMQPGYDRQPILQLVRPLTFRSADDACGLCGYWTCRCGGVAPAPAASTAGVTR